MLQGLEYINGIYITLRLDEKVWNYGRSHVHKINATHVATILRLALVYEQASEYKDDGLM